MKPSEFKFSDLEGCFAPTAMVRDEDTINSSFSGQDSVLGSELRFDCMSLTKDSPHFYALNACKFGIRVESRNR